MTSRAWDDDGPNDRVEDWERDLTRPDGFPLVATLAGSGAIILVEVLAFNFLTIDVVGHVAAMLGVTILVAAIVFAGAWLLTLRQATLGWNVLAGSVFAGVALMCVVVVLTVDIERVRTDAANIGLIKINNVGEPVLPPGIRSGPATTAAMDFVRKGVAEGHRRERLLRRLGLDRLTNASAIRRDPALVADCGRFKRAKPELEASDQRLKDLSHQFRRDLDRIIADEVTRDAALKGLDEGQGAGFANIKEMSTLQQAQLDRAGPLCTLISGRRWTPIGSAFMFSTSADLAAFNRIIEPWNDLVRKVQTLAARYNQEMRETGVVDANSRL